MRLKQGAADRTDRGVMRGSGGGADARGGGSSGADAPPGGRRSFSRGVVVAVVGARGGAGASTLAALVASRASRRTATVLVDLDEPAGGIDVLVGLEEEAGARWPDLAQARGGVDGGDVVALLPRWGRVAVLSADRSRPAPVEASVARDVLGALARASGCVVVDLGRAAALGGHAVLGLCDRIALVAGRDLRSVAGALALCESLTRAGADAAMDAGADVGLVVRGPAPGGLGADEVVQAIGLPALWCGRAEPAMVRAAEQGLVPARGAAGRAAAAVLAGLL